MKDPQTGIGQTQTQKLWLSPDEVHQKEVADEAQKKLKRRKYWQEYIKRVKRVFLTISIREFEELAARAEASGRSWSGQLLAEWRAYLRGERLLAPEETEHLRLAGVELRRIGNNMNQLARQGHIQARKHGGFQAPPGDRIGAEVLRQFTLLEQLIMRWPDGMKISVSLENDSEARDDH